jgi:hypothetical protein
MRLGSEYKVSANKFYPMSSCSIWGLSALRAGGMCACLAGRTSIVISTEAMRSVAKWRNLF